MAMKDRIGKTMKELRVKKKLTLQDISEQTKLSTGFLSKVERGISSITVESLAIIANCLDAPISVFLEDQSIIKNKSKDIITKSYERQLGYSEDFKRINFFLTNDVTDKDFLPKYIELLPGFNDEVMSSYHEGQEFIFVIEGEFTLKVNKEEKTLYPGDSAFFDSSLTHIWQNKTSKTVKMLCINSPNIYLETTTP